MLSRARTVCNEFTFFLQVCLQNHPLQDRQEIVMNFARLLFGNLSKGFEEQARVTGECHVSKSLPCRLFVDHHRGARQVPILVDAEYRKVDQRE